MNKLVKVLAASAMVATVLVGCKKAEPEVEAAKYAKVGLGTDVSVKTNEDGTLKQANTTIAVVGLDAEGKIAYLDLDVAQSPNQNDSSMTKEELKEKYGMVGNSDIKKEWFEQVEFLEEKAKGLTPDEFAKLPTIEAEGHPEKVDPESDLAAGCTMDIGSFKKAVAEAVATAVEVNADKIGAGETVTFNEDKGQVNCDIAAVALDKDGKIVWSALDTAQSLNGKDETKTKVELKEAYGMKDTSAGKGTIEGGAELYEQLANFSKFLEGKTADDVKGLKMEEGYAAKDSDLYAGCTIHVTGYQAALVEALGAAK